MKAKKNPTMQQQSLILQIKHFAFHYRYTVLLILILVLAFALRFYHFDMRWGLGDDDSRDIAIAQEAIARHELPLTGSFSSAGPFVFGPFFYWFIMLSYLLLPFVFTAPWILIGLVGVFTVAVLFLCGKKIAGTKFGLLVALFAALSPQLVMRSFTLGQHTFVAFTTSCALLCLLYFIDKRQVIFAFLTGLCIGAAINFHYQALNLLIFVPLFLFIPKQTIKLRVINTLAVIVGVLISLSPLIIWDSQQQFANLRNILDYFLIGQYRIYVPNSWRLFVFTFLPGYFSFVIGGLAVIAGMSVSVAMIVLLILLIKKKLPTSVIFLFIPFVAFILVNRYYKGERSEGYLLYLLPFIIILTAYGLYRLFDGGKYVQVRRGFAILLVCLIIVGNAIALPKVLAYVHPVPAIEKAIDELSIKYPHKKFAVYDYKRLTPTQSQALSILLKKRHLIDRNGMPIGVICNTAKDCPITDPVIEQFNGVTVVALENNKQLKDNRVWVKLNPENMYDDLVGWLNKHQLKSTFSLGSYLVQKFHL